MGYIGIITHLGAMDPNFLGHPGEIASIRDEPWLTKRNNGHPFLEDMVFYMPRFYKVGPVLIINGVITLINGRK